MNPRRWLHEHSLRLLAIRDTPEAIAGGVAIGIFLWFPPLFGLKTVGAIFLAWLTRSNILAAVLTVTLHDLFLPFMLVIYRWEYCLGFWVLSLPHHWPARLSRGDFLLRHHWGDWQLFWRTFSGVGKPLLLGSVLLGVPAAVTAYAVTKVIVSRHQRKKQPEAPTALGSDT